MRIVECREYIDCGDSRYINSNVLYIASSNEKAIQFIKENEDFGPSSESSGEVWWWVVYDLEIDTILNFNNIEFYSNKGIQLEEQP